MRPQPDTTSYPIISIGFGLLSAVIALLAPALFFVALGTAMVAIVIGLKAARNPSMDFQQRKRATAGASLGMATLSVTAILALIRVIGML